MALGTSTTLQQNRNITENSTDLHLYSEYIKQLSVSFNPFLFSTCATLISDKTGSA